MFGVECGDLGGEGVAVLPEAICVAAGLAVLPLGKWGLRHECTQARIIGFVSELDQLFLGDGEVVRADRSCLLMVRRRRSIWA